MDPRLFWKSLAVQALLVGALFGVLIALPLDDEFFEDYGFIVGPLAWLACSAGTARILALPLSYVLFGAVAAGVCGLIVLLAASHIAGMVVALLVFAASNATYDPDAMEDPV
ncbi:MAG TPA: hypothetical protein VHJ37_02985 [Thermoleophilaceae bacterium]|nr:hypothetical protein [Thermoleophilaceae bacterium]